MSRTKPRQHPRTGTPRSAQAAKAQPARPARAQPSRGGKAQPTRGGRTQPARTAGAAPAATRATPAQRLATLRLAELRRWPVLRPWLGTVARLVLGGVLLVAGWLKVGDLAESGRAVAAYQLMPYDLAKVVGGVLPFVEIVVGLLLVAGLATRLAGAFGGFLMVVFLIGIISAWARGLRIDCGCFGGGGDLAANEKPAYLSETLRDLGLLVLAGFLVWFPRTRVSVDGLLDSGRLLDGGVKR